MKLADLDKFVNQKEIHLYNEGLNDDDLDVLYKVIDQSAVLEELDLGYNELTLADGNLTNAIAKNTTLKVLFLNDNNISPRGVQHLTDALN